MNFEYATYSLFQDSFHPPFRSTPLLYAGSETFPEPINSVPVS